MTIADRCSRVLIAPMVLVALAYPLACTCNNASYGSKYGWRCEDYNEERGPARDRRGLPRRHPPEAPSQSDEAGER